MDTSPGHGALAADICERYIAGEQQGQASDDQDANEDGCDVGGPPGGRLVPPVLGHGLLVAGAGRAIAGLRGAVPRVPLSFVAGDRETE